MCQPVLPSPGTRVWYLFRKMPWPSPVHVCGSEEMLMNSARGRKGNITKLYLMGTIFPLEIACLQAKVLLFLFFKKSYSQCSTEVEACLLTTTS